MNKKPLVTVMIPTYNQEAYIARALKSVLEQSYENIEIIVSDDSPNDKTKEIIQKKFSEKNIKYIHHKNPLGRVKNYHFMLYQMAQGEWVVNLDGDDYFEDRGFIQRAIDIVTTEPEVVMVVAQQKIYNERTQSLFYPPKIIEEEYKIVPGEQLFLNSVFKNIEIPHLATLYNKKKAVKKGFYELDIVSSDRVSLLKLMLGEEVALLNRYAGVWVHHNNNTSQNMNYEELFSNVYMYDYLFNYAKQLGKIPYIQLVVWKSLGKYKSFYGYAVEILKNMGKKAYLKYLKALSYTFPIYAFLLLTDIRIVKTLVKVKDD
ncbi:glycosyltransferase family 2 protein [Sulfurimonas sp.]